MKSCLAANLTEWDKNRLQQQEEARLDLSMTLEIIKCHEHYLGKNHFRSAPVLFFLASLYQRLDQFEDCQRVLEQLMTMYQQKGLEHCCVATVHSHFGILFIAKQDFVAAEEVMKEALVMKTKLLGADHPHVGLIQYDLALAFWKQHKLEDCLYLLHNSHRILEANLGTVHPYVHLVRTTLQDIEKKLQWMEVLEERAKQQIKQ